MIYTMISSSAIIMKLAREFPGYNGDSINDTIEWIGEACEAIGYFGQTTIMEAIPVTIKNHRGRVPCDLYKLRGEPIYDGAPLPYGNGNFRYSKNANGSLQGSFDNPYNHSYNVSAGYFRTTFEEGTIEISYEAFQRDEDGFPMIPEYYEFKEAVSWYIKMKLLESGQSHPVLKYGDAVAQWEKFESKAYKKAELPDRPRMESFINSWVRLLPEVRPGNQFYETLRYPENITRE